MIGGFSFGSFGQTPVLKCSYGVRSSKKSASSTGTREYATEYVGPIPTEEQIRKMNLRPDGLYFFSNKPLRSDDGNASHALGKNLLNKMQFELDPKSTVWIHGPAKFVGEEQ